MEEDVSSKRGKKGKILIRIGISILALLLILISAIGIVLNTVLTPEKITPLVLNLAHEYIDAEVKCESIDITFFSTFPDLGIKLQNGSIIHPPKSSSDSTITGTPQDSLLAFGNFTVAVNPVAFLFDKQVIIHQLEIEEANIYAYVDETGKANWDIFSSSTESETEEEKSAFEMPELNIKNIRFQNINLVYDDMQQDMFVMVDTLRMKLSGNMSKDRAGLDFGVRTKGVTTYYQGQTFSKDLPLGIRTNIRTDRIEKSITLEKGNIYLGILQFKTNGILKKSEEEHMADVDIDFSLDASSMKDLLKMIPEHISNLPSKLTAEGKITSAGKISGKLGKETLPQITIAAQLTDGSLSSVKYPNKPLIEKFNFDFNTLLSLSGDNPSSLNLKNLFLQTASSKMTLKGKFNDILNNPHIDAQAQADINFTQLAEKLSFIEDMKMKGLINFDLNAKCYLDDVLSSNYGKINANGTANIKQLMFNHLKEDILIYASNADVKFGSNTQDSIRGKLHESLLRGYVSLDSLNINIQNNIKTNIGRLSASFSTSEPADSSSIAPIFTGARARNLLFTMGDSIKTQAIKTTASIRLQPRKGHPNLPEISARVSLDTLRGRFLTMAGRVSNAKVELKLSKQQERQRRVRPAADNSADSLSQINRTDTTIRVSQRNSLTRAQRDSLRQIQLNPQTNVSFRLESDMTRDILRKWNLSGKSTCDYISVRTPVFPLPLRMKDSDFSFSTDTLSLNNTNITVGSSSLSLKGQINGIRRALLYNSKVTALLSFSADSIDFNQLIKAAVAGSEYSQKSGIEKDTISEIVMDEGNDKIVEANVDTASTGIFVIPRNLDVELRARIKKGKFNHINIKNTQGRIILRNQAVQLPNFRLNTDIGSANVALVYKAPDMRGAHLGLELNVNQIDVKELIATFPMFDELTPMLRSFEGVVDCEMSAVTELDSLMNVNFPQTTASCFLKGKNLVLLDGETFGEISKMLMFKNKNRNLIDSVSVEMIMEDEKLMIFPFQVSMDRYVAGVGGTQNLDLSFDYHITVLKSPLPFKLGLNISGTPEKMKIRLAKAKYKDLFTVAKEENLDNTVINLRKEMDNRIRKNINDIAGSEQPIRRNNHGTQTIPDSIRQMYFKMDTTAVSVEQVADTVGMSEQ